MLSTPATPAAARTAAARWGAWAEMKWDGIRAVGVWDGSALRLYARSGTDVTARYPELTEGARFDAASAVVDGEVIALDAAGRPSFTRLQSRMHLTVPRQIEAERGRTPVRYHLFDVLAADGEDVASRPLRERRELLERIAEPAPPVIAVPPVFDDVDAALETAQRLGLEGIVLKDPSSRYRRGARSDEWLKVKLTRTQEVVIGGIRPGRGGRTGSIGSLLLGIPGPDGLRYVGRVGSGFSESILTRLQQLLEPLRTDADPFVGVPSADAGDALWVRPELVGEVEFAEFSPDGRLRQARWRGLRPDKAPADVRREG
jgi:bifunctional non-homologous end joining protein LigD